LNIHKAVILSVVREDNVDTIMNKLEEKFVTIKNGKGVAFAVPLSSVIGVNLYQFLSNNRLKRGEQ
jgi:nitrogen regulatory protein PII